MKKIAAVLICLVLAVSLVGCGSPKGGDYPATIMVNGTNYYSTNNSVPVEVDESVIKYTTSYAENGVPKKDGEANFNRDTGSPYAVLEDGMVVVLIDNEWIEFKTKYYGVDSFENNRFTATGNSSPVTGGADMPNNSAVIDTEETQNATTENNGASQKNDVLREPPALAVIYDENNHIEALRGTFSWSYQNSDGTWAGLNADSIHPLDAKNYMPKLSGSLSNMYLKWDVIPDNVSVRCWSEECWGQSDAESEEVLVYTLMLDSNIKTEPSMSIELKDANYIYELFAEWSSSEKYNGTACYSFYTVK